MRKAVRAAADAEFVEEFILAQTLDPAIEEFGLAEVRLIDPTCGSGHFLLGAFRRLLDRWQAQAPTEHIADRRAAQSIKSMASTSIRTRWPSRAFGWCWPCWTRSVSSVWNALPTFTPRRRRRQPAASL